MNIKALTKELENRRDNLIFSGHPEVLNNDDYEAIIRSFLQRYLGIDHSPIRIQLARRLGDLESRPWGRGQGQLTDPRPIIVAFTEYRDVERIMANAKKLAEKRVWH